MRIWILDCDVDKYENLTWKNGIQIDEVQTYDGREKLKNWKPMPVKRMYERPFSNSPGLSPHIPVFDGDAIEVLSELISKDAEILPLDCDAGAFYAINVTRVLDCVEYERARYKMFRDVKRIMRFEKYAFDGSKIGNAQIFKIVDEPLKRPFVSDEFRNKVIDNNLVGFIFKLAWDSEANEN